MNSELVDNLLHFYPKGLCALDLETTGLSPIGNEIIEIAIIKVRPDGTIEKMSELVRPEFSIPKETIDIHGITEEMVQHSRTISQVLPEAIEFIEQLPVLAHNAKFDLGFIVFHAQKNKIKVPPIQVYCSCQTARKLLGKGEKSGLSTLCRKLEVTLDDHHRALADAKACLEVFSKLLEMNKDRFKRHLAYLFNTKDYHSFKGYEPPEHIKRFEKEIFYQKPLLIRYKGGSLKLEYRPIKPTSVLPLPGGPVLYALCLISDQYKSFSLKKVKDIKFPSETELEALINQGKRLIHVT